MELINDLIVSIYEAGSRTEAYSIINTIANYTAILLGFIHGMKLRVGVIAVAVSIAVERYLSGPLATAIVYVENGFKDTGQQNAVVAFVFVPLIGFLLSKLLRKSYKELWDVMMVVPLMMFAGARIACTVSGCCRGYPCGWGLYNVKTGEICFPIQLLECLVAVSILIFVFFKEKKNNYVPDGKNVPIILISYGIARFFLEFLHDNTKIVAGLASTQFHCLFMIAVGVFALWIIKRSERKEMSAPHMDDQQTPNFHETGNAEPDRSDRCVSLQ